MTRQALAVPLIVGLLACGHERSDQASPHAQSMASCDLTARPKSTRVMVVVPDTPDPPCRLVIDTTLIKHYTAAEWTKLDLSRIQEVDQHGRLYAQSYEPGVILVLSSTGNKIAQFGRAGEGPGELTPGALSVYASPSDSVYVKDNSLRWSVFSSTFTFVRSVANGPVAAGAYSTCVLPSGAVIYAMQPSRSSGTATMQLIDPSGRVAATFGSASKDANPGQMIEGRRELACGLVGGIWALPSPFEPGYAIEHWSDRGELVKRITRTAAWFDAGAKRQGALADAEPPQATVRQVNEASAGVILTLVVTADRRWKPLPREEARAAMDTQYDARYEVIDAEAGLLLASERFEDPSVLPRVPFLRDGRAYQIFPEADGGASVVAIGWRLQTRAGVATGR